MSENQNPKPSVPQSIFETPVKRLSSNKKLLSTNDQSYEKSYPKSDQQINPNSISNHIIMNIFGNKKYVRTIKKSNLKLLTEQSSKLSQMRATAQCSSEAFKQFYKNQLDQVYVILARIEFINEDRKYYNIFCQDETTKEFKLYNLKNPANQKSVMNSNKPEIFKKRITKLDSLEFEAKDGEGTPYFKFFVIFREIPIFENCDNEILKSDEEFSYSETKHEQKRKNKPKVKKTEFRIYVEHFEKLEDFNEFTYHNMHIMYEEMFQRKLMTIKKEIFEYEI